MDSKTIIAAVVGAVASFLLGWLIWGIVLMNYFQQNIVQYPGLMLGETEFKIWAIFISNLAGCFMLAWVLNRMNARSFGSGATAGAIIYTLYSISMAMMFYSMMNWYSNSTVMIVEILVNTFFGVVIGGIIGMMLGRGKAAAA